MLKIGPLLLLTMLLIGQANSYTTESVNIVSSVSRLDLKSGRIAGEKADYYLDIPTTWALYLVADREKAIRSLQPLEKLNFYFIPSDNTTKPKLFLCMYIYNKFQYTLEPNHRKLLETTKYVFTVSYPDEGILKSKTDIAIFNNMRETASDDSYLIGLIRLFKGDEKLYNNTIWVNGKQLNTKAIPDGNVIYLPIRDVCEQLGYRVGWLADQNAVTLRRGDIYQVLLKYDINANRGFTLVFNNNKAYISSLYFISVLKLNVEIDERINVMLNES